MRRCKHCMKVYSENYDCCPNCGCAEFSQMAERANKPTPKPEQKADKKPLVIAAGVFFAVALVALVALIISFFPGDEKAEDENTEPSQQVDQTTDSSVETNTFVFPEYEEYVPEITYTTEPEDETTKKVASKKMRMLPDVSDCTYAEAEQVLIKNLSFPCGDYITGKPVAPPTFAQPRRNFRLHGLFFAGMDNCEIFIEIYFICNGDYGVAEHCFCVVAVGSDGSKFFFKSENILEDVFKFTAEIIVSSFRGICFLLHFKKKTDIFH